MVNSTPNDWDAGVRWLAWLWGDHHTPKFHLPGPHQHVNSADQTNSMLLHESGTTSASKSLEWRSSIDKRLHELGPLTPDFGTVQMSSGRHPSRALGRHYLIDTSAIWFRWQILLCGCARDPVTYGSEKCSRALSKILISYTVNAGHENSSQKLFARRTLWVCVLVVSSLKEHLRSASEVLNRVSEGRFLWTLQVICKMLDFHYHEWHDWFGADIENPVMVQFKAYE